MKANVGQRLVNRWTFSGVVVASMVGLWVVRDLRVNNASGAQGASVTVVEAGRLRSRPHSPGASSGSADRPAAAARAGGEVPPVERPSQADSGEMAGSTTPAEPGSAAPSRADAASGTADTRERLVGTWKLDDTIQRVIEIRSDGTATMEVKLDYFSALLYGKEMTLQLTWTVEGELLTHHLEKGVPAENVDRLIRDWGNERSYKIVRVSGEEMVLESMSDHDVHHWKRVAQEILSEADR